MSTYKNNQPVKLTKKRVDSAPIPSDGKQYFVRDAELKGFALRVSQKGTKAFVCEKRINGRVKRITLGKYGVLTTEEARRLAHRELSKIAMGRDPIAERKTREAKSATLIQCFEDFKKARKNLKPKTLNDYTRHIEKDLASWKNKPIAEISIKMVAQRHRQIGIQSGPHQANAVFRTLKSILNFARFEYLDGQDQPVLLSNPVEYLNHTRAWYPSTARTNLIKNHQLAPWYQAIQNIKGPDKLTSSHVIADFLLLVLFTGLRHQEAAQLRWTQIDFEDRSLHLPDPKNREPFTLPLSDVAIDILRERRELAVNEYVFPDRDGKKHLIEPRRQMRLITEATGIAFSVHDLRRTFATIASGLNFSTYTIKRLINHKVSDDVTDGYIICDVEQMRAPMQQVADFLKDNMGIANQDNVVYLESWNK